MLDIEQVYKENFQTVYKYLFCLSNNIDISEELTQETFCRAVSKINTYRGACKISVWLCQIAKNLWYDYCKKNNKLIMTDEIIDVNMNDVTSEHLILKEEKMLLYKKIQKLDSSSREVIYLRITGELSFKEIGIILNKTENWARVTYYRAKKKLKEADFDG